MKASSLPSSLPFSLLSSLPSKLILLGLAAAALSGCGPEVLTPPPDEQPTSVLPPTEVTASPSPIPITPTSPTQGNLPGGNEQPTSCDTATYFSEVVWEGGQPKMSLTQKPVAANGYRETKNLNKAPAIRTVNPDNSLTFASSIEGGSIYTRVFPNGSCFIQSVASSGAVVLEENGRIGGRSQPSPAVLPPAQVNYYDRGYQDGRSDAQAGRTYDPVRGSRNLPANDSREYTRGYADGYRAVSPNQGRPPVVDPTGPVNPPVRPPVIDPPGPVTPSPRPPVVDPPGPGQSRPPVTDPVRPVTPSELTRPVTPGSPNPQ